MTVTNIKLITNGIVRNLLKTPYYLRVPADPYRRDRIGKKIVIPSTEDVEIDYRDWKLVEFDLITKDRLNILRIIKYPEAVMSSAGSLTVINNYYDLPPTPPPGTITWVQYGPYQGIYYYDTVRNEWLSENEMIHTWNSATDVNTVSINLMHHTNDTQTDNDVDISIPMTITGMAVSQVNPIAAGNVTRFAVGTYSLATGVKVSDITHVDLTAVGARGNSDTTLNAPVDAGTVISATRIKLSGTDKITRPALTLWYRWRLVP
jgi:hypothetical protein